VVPYQLEVLGAGEEPPSAAVTAVDMAATADISLADMAAVAVLLAIQVMVATAGMAAMQMAAATVVALATAKVEQAVAVVVVLPVVLAHPVVVLESMDREPTVMAAVFSDTLGEILVEVVLEANLLILDTGARLLAETMAVEAALATT
tara:strand:- start:159 stop:602 length:444 start_codon:yes stop_codon:yes gene_type:complete